MKVLLHQGSVEDALPSLDAESFDASLSDPPYGLSFMGKEWDRGVPGPAIWAGVHAALRPGAHLLAFGGTRTFHRLTCAIEDAGFEIRDCLAWLYGSGFPKSLDVSKAIDERLGEEREVLATETRTNEPSGIVALGRERTVVTRVSASAPASAFTGYGTALKPAWEPCILAMRPCDGTFAANALRHGVAGLAIDAGRIDTGPTYTNHTRKSNDELGWHPKSTGQQTIHSGRWPANVLLDETAAEMLDAQSGTLQSGTRAEGEYGIGLIGSPNLVRPMPSIKGDSGGASRFFYTAKANVAERQKSRHPTLKPIDLCAYLARLLLPPKREDGEPRRILVPFSGAGSEMIGCLRAGWDEVVGIEREAEYVKDAERRMWSEFGLLADIEVRTCDASSASSSAPSASTSSTGSTPTASLLPGMDGGSTSGG